MPLQRLSSFSKKAVLLSLVLITASVVSRPLVAEEESAVKPEPRIVKASQTVELVRIAAGLTHIMDLQKDIEERFSNFESDLLFDVNSVFPGVENAKSDVSFGQCVGFVPSSSENYVGIVYPAEVTELFDEEDYEFGEDADGNPTIDGQRIVKADKYFCYVDVPDEIQFEGLNQLGRTLIDYVSKSESKVLLIESSPATIGRSLIKNELLGYRAALDTAAQRQDNETDLDYGYRSLTSGHFGKLVELFFRDVENLSVTVLKREPASPFVFEVAIDCRKKSELLSYFQEMKQRRNRALSWLHPSSDAFATLSLALPERIQEQLLAAGKFTAQAIQDDEKLGAQAGGQVKSVFRGLAESGAFEVLLQQVPFDEESSCYVGLVPLTSGSVFDSELVQLVSDQDSLTTVTEIDGWPVYAADGWFGLDLDEGWVPCVVATDSMLALIVFKEADQEKGVTLLTELKRREYSPARQGSRYANAIMAAEFTLSNLANFMASDRSGWEAVLPTNLDSFEASQRVQLDQDRVTWSMGLDGQRVVARCQFEPNALALGVQCFELFMILVSDLADL